MAAAKSSTRSTRQKDVASEPPRPLTLIYGNDRFMVSKTAKAILDALVPEADRDMCLETVDADVDSVDEQVKAIRDAVDAVRTPTLFGGAKTVWLRDMDFLALRKGESDDDPSDDDSGRERIKEMVEFLRRVIEGGIPDGHSLLITGNIPGNNGLVNTFKKLEKSGVAALQQFAVKEGRVSEGDAVAFVRDELRDRGVDTKALPASFAPAFVSHCGTDLQTLGTELAKLLAYAGDSAPTVDDIAAICTPTRDAIVWSLLDVFGERDLPRLLQMYRRLLASRVSEIFMVIQLTTRANQLLLLRDSIDRGYLDPRTGNWNSQRMPPAVASDLESVDPKFDVTGGNMRFRIASLIAQCQNFTRVELRKARHALVRAHDRMVSVGLDSKAVLEMALIEALRK